MSDTRSSFQVPAPRTDGVTPDAPEATGEREQAPPDPGRNMKVGGEEMPTARWPVPDYAEPPTGAWDRHRPPGGSQTTGPLWPVADPADLVGHIDRNDRVRHTENTGPTLDDEPETHTFDRPKWDEAPSAVPPHDLRRPSVPAWETRSPGDEQPTPPDGFSYWERRPIRETPGTATSAPTPGEGPRGPETARPPGRAAAESGTPEPQEALPPPAPAKRAREPYLDNVKFVLIALVVTGHSLVPTLGTHSSRSAYMFIYVFHMPLFVVISGYLSRNFWNSNAKTNKLVDTFLVPYVIVEICYAALRFAFGHKWSLTIIDPAWLNWYLLALLLWRLSTPVWKRMRHPFPIAVAVYLLAGLSDLPGDFSMDRFFGLMPFFVLGLWLQPRHFAMLDRTWIKIMSVGVLVGAAGVAYLLSPHVALEPLYYKDAYAELKLSWWMGMGMRAGLLIAALTISAAILALVPRKNTWFSDLGTRTLYCYLLHGVPVFIAKEMGWLKFSWLHGPLGVMAIASSAFALAIILCLPETRTVFKWLLEPRLTWLYRRPSA